MPRNPGETAGRAAETLVNRTAGDDDEFPQPLGTGQAAFSERDIGRNRPVRKREFPFGFTAADLPEMVSPVRNRHRGTVRSGR